MPTDNDAHGQSMFKSRVKTTWLSRHPIVLTAKICSLQQVQDDCNEEVP